jgi:hypothetical protein
MALVMRSSRRLQLDRATQQDEIFRYSLRPGQAATAAKNHDSLGRMPEFREPSELR